MKYFWWFCLAIGFQASAQVPKTEDSLKVFLSTHKKDTLYVDALNEMAFVYVQKSEFEKVSQLIAQMDVLSKKLKYPNGYYKVVNMRGIAEYSHQNFAKAMTYFEQAGQIIQKYKLQKARYQTSLNNIMIIYSDMGNREKATEYATKLITYQEKYQLKPYRSAPYIQLGNNLKFYKKPLEALPYFNKALEIETEIKSLTGIAISENAIGNLYDDLKDDKQALIHYNNGLIAAENADYKLLQTDLLINIARIQKHLKRYEQAERNLLRCERICKEIEVTVPLKTLYHNLGDVYAEQKKTDLAEKTYFKALAIAKTMDDPEASYSINQALADFMHEKGDSQKAYEYLAAAQTFKDTLFKLETAKTTEEMLRRYEARDKEQKIAALSAKQKLDALQIENATRQRLFLISGMVFLATLLLLIFRQSATRKKNNERLRSLNLELDEANKVKTRFLGIINHDLKSPVSSLLNFLYLQKESPEMLDEPTRVMMQDRTISSAENLLASMQDILLWSKGQMDQFKPQIKTVEVEWLFDDLKRHFSHVQNVAFYFENSGPATIETDEHYLKTILRNLIANAANALTETKNATVSILAGADCIAVSDNGPGADTGQLSALYHGGNVSGLQSGLGLHLIRDMAAALGYTIVVESDPGKGTTITIGFYQK